MLAPTTQLNELRTLVGLFYSEMSHLGDFAMVEAASLPDPDQRLLAHNHHMTAALEAYQGLKLDVDVLQWANEGNRYWRKILLRRPSVGRVVQFAIVRLNFNYFSAEVRRKVESRETPLGRVLLENNVTTEIEVRALWRITPSSELCQDFGILVPTSIYGRTALILHNGKPAIELLEILAPQNTR